mgnify:CR=1 FL=1
MNTFIPSKAGQVPPVAGQVLESLILNLESEIWNLEFGIQLLYPCLQPQRGGISSKGCSPLSGWWSDVLSPEGAE